MSIGASSWFHTRVSASLSDKTRPSRHQGASRLSVSPRKSQSRAMKQLQARPHSQGGAKGSPPGKAAPPLSRPGDSQSLRHSAKATPPSLGRVATG
eukprot:6192339-Pleurochrysis_carterae.AAC.1